MSAFVPPKPSSSRAAIVSGDGGFRGSEARRLAREPLDDLVAQGVSLLAHGGADRRLQALWRSREEPPRPCPISRA
jgi:hypothetical protein